MDKALARKLVKETLQNPFDKERFTRLVKEICKKPDASKAFQPIQGAYLREIFRPYIKSYERIATYTDPEGKKTDILIVNLQKESSLERARTAQRNFIARYLKDRDAKDAAIVAFVSPDDSDWRFSFVKMEYKLEATDKGKLKAKEEFTPARRYSFLVGAQENSHTAQSRLLHLLADDKHLPLLAELEDAFSIEKVTKEFFEKYRELYLHVSEALDGLVKDNAKIRAEFEKQGVETADFAKKLLGQIVFLYFLQKKGWFGVGRDEDWGTGPKNFLRKLFNKDAADYKNFFNDILEPLFYEALARERDSNFYNQFNCKIPFLNGGLFDPLNNYDWVHTDIKLPNELFSNDYKTSEGDEGTGILDVFDRYNFTVKEDEPLEKEVAIDPEMLGKVFENLLEVKDRKSKGTYYTPREIVHYMCQQSLVYYLANELDGKVSKAEVETFIKYGESALEHDARVAAKGKETDDYSYKLPASIREHAGPLDAKLAKIKVCDPAVGSGAFLVGMMSEIVRARKTLNAYLGDKSARTPYEFKHHAIHGSLYGVDIDPSAVEIAKLRLWLSLVVDEDDIKHVKPLPNLDYKIMQGNSLLEEYEGIKLFDEKFILGAESEKEQTAQLKERERKIQQEYIRLHSEGKLTRAKKAEFDAELKQIKAVLKKIESGKQIPESPMMFDEMNEARRKVEELQKLHLEFFESSQKSRKDAIREQIDTLEWELIEATLKENGKTDALKTLARYRQTNTKPFFLWKLHFSDVFRDKKGFDVVIANPPYVSHDKIFTKNEFKRNFQCFEPFADIYCYFIELAIRLANLSGSLCYITSNSYLRADYGKNLRKALSDKCSLHAVINIEDFQIFDTAIVNTAVLLAQNKSNHKETACLVVNAILPNSVSFDIFVDDNKFYYSQSDFSGKSWTLNSTERNALQAKIEKAGKSLEALNTKIRLGIATGANEAFVVTEATKNNLIKENPKSKQIIRPILRGRDISRYAYDTPKLYILLTKNGIDIKNEYPAVYNHLDAFGAEFKQRGAQGQHWTNLRACAFFDDFKKEKIIWIELADKGRFALCCEEVYLLNSAYFLLPPDNLSSKYLLAILNSRLIEFYLHLISETSGMGTCRWINNYVKEFPIPEIAMKAQQSFIALVDKTLALKSQNPDADTTDLENKIDQQVYKLYNLTPSEIAIVEKSINV
ncbi:MAG: N-6 DNA methylase [Candidatus Omnitrophota bacterium]